MGLLVFVYRAAHGSDCTNGGVSSRAQSLCVVNVAGPFEPDEATPAVILECDTRYGSKYPKLVPAIRVAHNWFTDPSWLSSGGNYAGTSDSRWADTLRKLTGTSGVLAPIHDRHEKSANEHN